MAKLLLVPVRTITPQHTGKLPNSNFCNVCRVVKKPINVMAFLILLFSWNSAKSDVVIANFTADYLAGTATDQTRVQRQNDGWNYMYNPTGSVGTASTYQSLVWKGAQYLPLNGSATPAVWNTNRVHPGDGSQNVILAYTIQSGEDGYISIANSSILAASGAGITYSIFVGDTQNGTTTSLANGVTGSFNRDLGYLNVGQTVYVTVGNGGNQSSDETQLSYQLVMSVPEPGTLLLGSIAVACGGGGAWWRRRKNNKGKSAEKESVVGTV